MCVLSANGGRCVYWCSRPAETMDHVVPFANGGSDDLDNLLPACRPCNNAKQKRDPVRWYIAQAMDESWHGRGSLTARGPGGEAGLRGRYLTFHEEVLGALDDLEEVAAEVRDPDRQAWFLKQFFHLGRHPGIVGPQIWLAFYGNRIAEAQERGFSGLRATQSEA
ncbi:HNH endonuclease [Streptomyces sp. NPDC093225]|uniref:HNH endonuclease n=1 Tax=Streptomyces sp. NPDC093225 TaxID=3366034 RepID=UPI0038058A03